MGQIPVMIDEEIVSLLGVTGEQLERSVLEMMVLELYRRHDVSAIRASQLVDMDFMTFLRWSGGCGVPYLDLTAEEWEAEVRTVEELSTSLDGRR
ncbi:MAG: UPF0175 family protein [Thermomicrobiales bacterium]